MTAERKSWIFIYPEQRIIACFVCGEAHQQAWNIRDEVDPRLRAALVDTWIAWFTERHLHTVEPQSGAKP